MRLTYSRFDLVIEMLENSLNTIVIENKSQMAIVVEEIFQQCEGLEGGFVLSEKNELVRIDKRIDLVIDPFRLDFNDKKIINRLYQQLGILAEDFVEDKEKINSSILCMLDNITSGIQYPGIAFNFELDWNNIFKLYGVRLEKDYKNLLEKLVEYIKIQAILTENRVCCLINIRTYLNQKELLELHSVAENQKISLLLIEATEPIKIVDETLYIIDIDQCLVIK